MKLFAKDQSITEIAHKLRRDVRTISRQKRDAMNKLGVKKTIRVFAFVRAQGLG